MGKGRKVVNPERKRRRFSPEFKLEAVRLLEVGQKPATQLALELGVARSKLYQWQEQAKARGKDRDLDSGKPDDHANGISTVIF